MNAQDQGVDKPKENPDAKLMRPELQNKLCKLLLKRYMAPIHEWTINGGAKNAMKRDEDGSYVKDDKEYWFVLLIHGDKNKGAPIWVKFYLSYGDLVKISYEGQEGAISDWIFDSYWSDKVNSLREQIEQCAIEHMNDDEYEESIAYGTAYLYRLVSKDSLVEKLRKEDKIY